MMPDSEIAWASIASDLGTFHAGYSASGLAALRFPVPSDTTADATLSQKQQIWHSKTAQAVQAVLARRPLSPLPPLDFGAATEFQKAVWQALLHLENGASASYREIAQAIGRPHAARAVGQACGRNPIPLLIPCHRVLASGGRLGGFSSGLDMKRILLRREATPFFDSK